MAAPNVKIHLMMINLATVAKVTFNPLSPLENILLLLNVPYNQLPNAFFCVQNIHLHPTLSRSGRLVNFYILLAMNKSYSSYVAAFDLIASSYLNALHKFK